MTEYYTGKGDSGTTGVLDKNRLPKSDSLIEAIGSIDELNSSLGIAIFYIHDDELRRELRLIQNELFIIGANLASMQNEKIEKAKFDTSAITRVEEKIRKFGASLPELKQFVIPGGSEGSVYLHLSRTIARRSERAVVRASERYEIEKSVIAYINRLSSFFFVASLYLNNKEGIEESHPTY